MDAAIAQQVADLDLGNPLQGITTNVCTDIDATTTRHHSISDIRGLRYREWLSISSLTLAITC